MEINVDGTTTAAIATGATALGAGLAKLLDWLGRRHTDDQGTIVTERRQLSADQAQLFADLRAAVVDARESARQAREDREACERERLGLQATIGRLTARVEYLERELRRAGGAVPLHDDGSLE